MATQLDPAAVLAETAKRLSLDVEALRAENTFLRQAFRDQQADWRRFLDDLESRLSRPLRERK